MVIDGAVYNDGITTAANVRSGGALHVYDGGSSGNTVVEAGGYQYVGAGGSASGSVVTPAACNTWRPAAAQTTPRSAAAICSPAVR